MITVTVSELLYCLLIDLFLDRMINYVEYIAGVLPIQGKIQTYAWGKPGHHSEVARLHAGADDSFTIDEQTPYAEVSIFPGVSLYLAV